MVFTLASLASFNTQGYSYYPIDSVSINVYATNPNPQQGRVTVNAGQMTDTGAVYYLNLPVPAPGSYILIAECYGGANLFLNSNIAANPYPISIPGVFSITGNSNKYNPNNASDTTFDQGYYFPMYDIGLSLDECPGPRTAVTPTTEAAPSITLAGQYLYQQCRQRQSLVYQRFGDQQCYRDVRYGPPVRDLLYHDYRPGHRLFACLQ